MPDDTTHEVNIDRNAGVSAVSIQRWGGLASFLLVSAFIIAPLIYLVGDLRDAIGRYAYGLADFLYGPVWAVSLVTAAFALRERIGARASNRMSLALLAAVLAAGTMVLVACIRSSNRSYHLLHPELHLETSATVLVVWTTLVQGVIGAGWHFLGWALVLIGWAGLTTRTLPRALSILYLAGGAASLFVYLFPDLEGAAATLGLIWAVWQGILLLKTKSGDTQAPVDIGQQSS